jgi:fructose-1,6-bisphosphatase I
MEIAGGQATNGENPVLTIQPKSLHERTPVFIGSKHMMQELETFFITT